MIWLILLFAWSAAAENTPQLPEHLRRTIVYSQRDFHEAAQRMYGAQTAMYLSKEGVEFLSRKREAAEKSVTMSSYQDQAKAICAAGGMLYNAELIVCVPKPPPVLGAPGPVSESKEKDHEEEESETK